MSYIMILSVALALAGLAPIAALALAVAVERKRREKAEKPPQEEKLLRPPGHSLALRLEEVQEATMDNIVNACVLCGLAGVSAVMLALFLATSGLRFWAIAVALLVVAFGLPGALMTLRAFRRLKESRNLRLGISGEQAVAETLHEVGDSGFRAFHDLPGGENWNIDHVAVGSRGVFLIETKARSRRVSRNGKPEHVVVYDGKSLQFPAGDDTKAIPQAVRNAKWLSEYLQKRTGEAVTVEPVVVVPGWFVEPKGNYPVKVMNATYLAGYLRGQREKLEKAQVQRIVAALDDKCRDVEF